MWLVKGEPVLHPVTEVLKAHLGELFVIISGKKIKPEGCSTKLFLGLTISSYVSLLMHH